MADLKEQRNIQLVATKAGMEGLDIEKINEIINSASKGSNYYLHQQRKQKSIDEKISNIIQRRNKISAKEIELATSKVDKIACELESKRNLNHVIVHIDMDAFFAAVEMRNNPELKDIPMAVGSNSMLSTSNYLARRFGVRAAMPGFIGLKLCPQLKIVPPDFNEYRKASREVEEVLADYDPDLNMASLDEAYLDITNYLKNQDNRMTAGEVVNEMRRKIFEKTQLTGSAGIAPNMMLAKICSDQNKPNGQFEIEFTKESVITFIRKLKIRKVGGIGNVTEQLLNSLGISSCGDLWNERGLLSLLFSSSSSIWFLELSLGIGSVKVKCEDSTRKSMSVERTFTDASDFQILQNICDELSRELSSDLIQSALMGKTVTLKIKSSQFDVKTRAKTLPRNVNQFEDISVVANQLLHELLKNHQFPPIKLRLMGVRMSNLCLASDTRDQITLDDLFEKNVITSRPTLQQEENLELPAGIQETVSGDCDKTTDKVGLNLLSCPVCNKESIYPSLIEFNQHLDQCLTRNTIKDLVNPREKFKPAVKKRKRDYGTLDKFIKRNIKQ